MSRAWLYYYWEMSFARELAAIFQRDLTRLAQQIEAFPEDRLLWEHAPGITNSAGNLALHLEGNLREFVGRILGNIEYQRQREKEFSDKGLTRADLAGRARELKNMIPAVLESLTPEQLSSTYPVEVMGGTLPTQQFLIHISGHFNYHLGQIDYLRRILTGGKSVTYAGL